MPQLMPMMWVMSLFMSVFFLMILINMYSYKDYNLDKMGMKNIGFEILFVW